ncbi:unnamed protein product [Paramecium pentaurelia]|uniref:Calcium-dependent protein kinase 1 n=1 Tax=Paramecium pentaurelia TaxID=43138 RepID=A0A8S1Y2L8_9CILI|nr:unnamed protein product [Paramecium pentaurelia]
MDNQLLIKKQWLIKSRPERIEDIYESDKKELGSGAYGRVFKAKHKELGLERAIKVIPKKLIASPDRFKREIEIMQNLDHPNIIKLFESFEDSRNVYLVMEICTGGELFDTIIEKGHFTEKEAQQTFLQIMQAIHYCHTHGICHRDLKPENFLLLNKTIDAPIKVIDFGLSVLFHDSHYKTVDGKTQMKSKAGTPYYISPEVLDGKYDELCDVWSAGVILYILLTGLPPFNGRTDAEILKAVKSGVYKLDIPQFNGVSNDVKDLIQKMLTKPDQRLTAGQVLQHPWLTSAEIPHSILTLDYKSFKGFSASNKLKKVTLTYIASQLSEVEIQELGKLFKELDQNGDGILTLEEVKKGLHNFQQESWGEVIQILKAIDTDCNGVINYTEFIAATMERNTYMKKEKLLQAFKMFDVDGSGKISSEELKKCLGDNEIYQQSDPSLWQNLINEADQNKDGEIDYLEFVEMMDKVDAK